VLTSTLSIAQNNSIVKDSVVQPVLKYPTSRDVLQKLVGFGDLAQLEHASNTKQNNKVMLITIP